MNTKPLLILLAIVGFSSCTTAYKIGQTPDDVYYSPAPPQTEYVTVKNEEERYNDNSPAEDREVRRRINRRLRIYDDYGYNYPLSYPSVYMYPSIYSSYPYGYSYYPYSYNYYYPYTSPLYVYPKNIQPTYIAPRRYNLGTYTSPVIVNKPGNARTGSNAGVRTFTKPTNTGSGVGNFIRRALTPSSNNNSGNNSQSRTFEPSNTQSRSSEPRSSSSSSSSGSSSGGNAPVRSFHR